MAIQNRRSRSLKLFTKLPKLAKRLSFAYHSGPGNGSPMATNVVVVVVLGVLVVIRFSIP